MDNTKLDNRNRRICTMIKLKIWAFFALLAFLLVTASSCKNAGDRGQDASKTAENALAVAVAEADTKPGEEADTKPGEEDNKVQEGKKCPANADDPDGLYRDFFDCKTPFPMKDGKAAKYDKSWKEGDDGALMNGYEFHEITQEFIDDYKKALEAAGYINDRPVEAPPIYSKKLSETSELRVVLTDSLCKEWLDCDETKKTGDLRVETAIMTFDVPEEPEPVKPSQDAEKIKAAYHHPADPDKLYAGLPDYCIFPIKDGKAFPYVEKSDLLDDPATRDADQLVYSFVSTATLDIDDFISKTFGKQLKDAGFEGTGGGYTRKTGNNTCTVTWDSGEGELNLRFYISDIEDSSR